VTSDFSYIKQPGATKKKTNVPKVYVMDFNYYIEIKAEENLCIFVFLLWFVLPLLLNKQLLETKLYDSQNQKDNLIDLYWQKILKFNVQSQLPLSDFNPILENSTN